MQYLKQSTASTVQLGPFLDEDDGKTAETGLTISQADVRLSKGGAAFAQANDTNAATHDEAGWYRKQLDATDTGTLGRLLVAVHESGALPVWREFMVIPSNEYDSLISGSDALQVDAVEVSSSSAAADNVEANIGNLDASVSTVDTVVDGIKAVTDLLPDAGALDDLATILADTSELQGDWANGGRLDLLVDGILADTGTDGVVISAATANEIADALLKRDWTSVSGEAARSALNALRHLRNKWEISGGDLIVYEEDDSTEAWSGPVTTNPGAEPVTSVDPT